MESSCWTRDHVLIQVVSVLGTEGVVVWATPATAVALSVVDAATLLAEVHLALSGSVMMPADTVSSCLWIHFAIASVRAWGTISDVLRPEQPSAISLRGSEN
jgi:hypothetical protein